MSDEDGDGDVTGAMAAPLISNHTKRGEKQKK